MVLDQSPIPVVRGECIENIEEVLTDDGRAVAARRTEAAECRMLSDVAGGLDDADSSVYGDARRSASIHAGRLSFADADAVAVAGLEGCRQSCQGRQGPALPAARTHARTPRLGRLATQFLTASGATEKENPLSLRGMSANPQTRAGRTADQGPEKKAGHNHDSPNFAIESPRALRHRQLNTAKLEAD